MESWRDIKGYEGYYQVSNLGRVRSLDRIIVVNDRRYKEPRRITRRGRILKDYSNGTDRLMVILRKSDKGKNISVHRLVAQTFIANPDNLPVVNHLNHNYRDNRVANLEWCTYSANTRHAIAAGRMPHIFTNRHKTLS